MAIYLNKYKPRGRISRKGNLDSCLGVGFEPLCARTPAFAATHKAQSAAALVSLWFLREACALHSSWIVLVLWGPGWLQAWSSHQEPDEYWISTWKSQRRNTLSCLYNLGVAESLLKIITLLLEPVRKALVPFPSVVSPGSPGWTQTCGVSLVMASQIQGF